MLRVLILGGTGDAAELTARISNITGIEAIASLAGRTREPVLPAGPVRVGGFGGVTGLVEYLQHQQIDVLIDATHPFAHHISWNAAAAATEAGIPRLLVNRPPWEKLPGDDWIEVENITDAAAALESQALENQTKRIFLTIGRQEISAFTHLQAMWFLMRMIDPLSAHVITPPGLVLCDRGPFHLENEREILTHHQIDTIVSKNSGGNATYPKIIAAREMGIQVVMVNRPPIPPGEQVPDVESAVKWLLDKFSVGCVRGCFKSF
ncbi:cobalt-precorrin-6A reductase [Sphaerospermopsis aphanizomenoides BCCUSP55]|uniref:cobalt-precorrin-6A reductase n=1 Tax=Sphaerospermopsis aphanizomenoides TaxID=459663 RepID=UPI000A3E652B|nr:cobalt-precorrin-6A reductase [Sphaerospermopsis aphanizomenoides]MBK1987125.1 cobalt-precorrin-6A reductase [Sphaerospermopsis aphanizomenoides BCCUSP55]